MSIRVFVEKEHRPRERQTGPRLVRLLGRDQREQHGGLMPQNSACQQAWCVPISHFLPGSNVKWDSLL